MISRMRAGDICPALGESSFPSCVRRTQSSQRLLRTSLRVEMKVSRLSDSILCRGNTSDTLKAQKVDGVAYIVKSVLVDWNNLGVFIVTHGTTTKNNM